MFNSRFKSLKDLQDAFPTEQHCIDYLEEKRWGGKVVSPFDPTSKVYKCKDNKYRCKNTGKYFNVKTKLIFHKTSLPLIYWFMAIWLVLSHKKGISSIQLSKDIGVTQKTAWFMLHRIRKALGIDNDKPDDNNEDDGKLEGTVEIDETFIGGKVIASDGVDIYYNHRYVNHGAGFYGSGDLTTNHIEGFWALVKRSIMGIYYHWSKKHMQKYIDECAYRFNTRLLSDKERFDLFFAEC